MEIVHKNGPEKGAFLAKDGDKTIGEMTYVWTGDDNFIIDHTGVSSAYQDKGIGNKMVERAVDYARENNITILPLCSFARSVFDSNPSYNDVRKN